MEKKFKYYLAIVAAILLVTAGAIWGGAMNVFGDTGAAWLGSIGTIFTLAFLIVQNTSQAKEIAEERAKREDHENKQQQMWDEQKKMLHFERAVKHRELFEQLLNEIEKFYEGTIEFKNRSQLYRLIFTQNIPSNDHSSYQYHLEQSTLENDHIFLRENRMKNEIYELMKNPNSIIDLDHLDNLYERLINCYGINIIRPPMCGDFLNNRCIVFNIFDADKIHSTISAIGYKLKEFCGLELQLERVGGFHSHLDVFKVLVNLYKQHKYYHYHSLHLGHHDIVLVIYELTNIIGLIPGNYSIHEVFSQAMVTRNQSGLLYDMENKTCIESFMKEVCLELAFVNGLLPSDQQKVDNLRIKIENKLRQANLA
ncbi:hypothetical protein LG861_002428 [Vibrio fluvialis]|nr:hypothetical protein [Vibrio fluvialis]